MTVHLMALIVLVGCGPETSDTEDTGAPTGGDDTAISETGGDDTATGGDDTAITETGETGDPYDGSDRALQGYVELDQSGEWTHLRASFWDASGYVVTETWLDPMEGEGDCGIVRRTGEGDVIVLSAGDVVFSADGDSVTVPWGSGPTWDTGGGGGEGYGEFTLEEAGYAPRYGVDYGVEAPGDGFPGFALAAAVRFPEAAMVVTSPSISGSSRPSHSAADPLAVTWSGAAGVDDVLVVIYGTAGGESVELRCETDDDGAFEVPADVLGQLSEGSVTLEVVRYQISSHDVGDDAWLTARAQSRERGKIDLIP